MLNKVLNFLRKIGGVYGIAAILTLAFISLKIFHVISWNWFWTLSPLWILAGIILLGLFCIYLYMFVYSTILKIKYEKKFREFKKFVDTLPKKKRPDVERIIDMLTADN